MSSYNSLLSMDQQWPSRLGFPDDWISDVYAKETEGLSAALHSSFSSNSSDCDVFSPEIVDFVTTYNNPCTTPFNTPPVSVGSENEALFLKKRSAVSPRGRIVKRKSRPSKRAAVTTFIVADPASFRGMVQQVTGVRFGGQELAMPTPEPQGVNVMNTLETCGELPTLDTSALFLAASGSSLDGGAAEAERCVDYFCSFPTLESWKAA